MIPLEEPFTKIQHWLEEASQHPHIKEPTAMSVATVDSDGMPSVRTLLLKGLDVRGLQFYTNSESRKGHELQANPKTCINFYWMPLGRQIRARGRVEKVTEAESDAYFRSRRRGSQIGAWASEQSRPLENYAVLEKRVAAFEAQFEGKEVPRPPHWYGWRLIPQEIEFWQERDFRLHHREYYTRQDDGWQKTPLYP
jgi:pyridoxamine 5'-phosphate oxidase